MTKPMKQPPIPTNPNQGAIPMTSNPGIISHTPSKRRDKATVVNAFVVLRGALAANPTASYDLPSGTITVPELTQEIDEYVAAVGAVEAARQAFHAAVEKEKKLRAKPTLHRAELKAVVAAHIGKHAVELARYGFAPDKVRVVSPQAKLLGAIKAQATRVARGTMGRRQRLAVRGTSRGW